MARLSEVLQLPPRPLVAIVGAGGKTTTMYTLARELVAQGRRVITTTTTNIYLPRPDETEYLLVDFEMSRLLQSLQAYWHRYRRISIASEAIDAGKLKGLQPEQPALLLQQGGADAVIVEADGARHLKIKAPAEYEPVMPRHTNLVLLLLSAEALNQPLTGELAHRPEILARLIGIEPGDLLTPAIVARLLLHEQGGMKGVPEGARVYVLVTHATEEQRPAIADLARLLQEAPRIADLCYSRRVGEWYASRG